MRKYEISGEISTRVRDAVRPTVRGSADPRCTTPAGDVANSRGHRQPAADPPTAPQSRGGGRHERATPLGPASGRREPARSATSCCTRRSLSSARAHRAGETTEKNIVRIPRTTVTNQKQQRASGRGCPDARWRCFAAPSGPVSGGGYSAVIEAEALVLAEAESPAEALERGHSMRCLMMRRLSA